VQQGKLCQRSKPEAGSSILACKPQKGHWFMFTGTELQGTLLLLLSLTKPCKTPGAAPVRRLLSLVGAKVDPGCAEEYQRLYTCGAELPSRPKASSPDLDWWFPVWTEFWIECTFALCLANSNVYGTKLQLGLKRHHMIQKWCEMVSTCFQPQRPTQQQKTKFTSDEHSHPSKLPNSLFSVCRARDKECYFSRILQILLITTIIDFRAVTHFSHDQQREGCFWPKVTSTVS
jgi:hypothetical protein